MDHSEMRGAVEQAVEQHDGRPPAAAMLQQRIETEIGRWSWAGFLWGWVWAVGNRVWIGLLGLIPGVSLIVSIVLGLKGRRWAWEKRTSADLERFVRVQHNWVVAWFVVVPIGLLIGLPTSIYAIRMFVLDAKRAEARVTLAAMGERLLECAPDRGLPETSRPIPPSLEMVRAEKYQSAPNEWHSQQVFACGGFWIAAPQYFQYQWRKTSETSGEFVARADLDGDGQVDQGMTLTLPVTCSPAGCRLATLVEGETGE